MALIKDDEAYRRVKGWIHRAFGTCLVIDRNNPQTVVLKMSQDDPGLLNGPGLHLNYWQKAIPVSQMGDGIKAFVGIITSVASFPYRLILIDEPESFLHPSAAIVLAKALQDVAALKGTRVAVSTHSEDFLYGCLATSSSVAVVRLDYDGNSGSASCLLPEDAQTLSSDPLLRTSEPWRAVFHKGAVVVEAADDRSFYEEVHHQIATARSLDRSDVSFLAATNKQTIPRLVKALRSVGVPTAGIFDLDILREGSDDPQFRSVFDVGERADDLAAHCKMLVTHMSTLTEAKEAWSRLDPSHLPEAVREALGQARDILAAAGVFVVPRGGLESWIPGAKKGKVFFKACENGYFKSEDASDCGDFVLAVNQWLGAPLSGAR